MDDDGLPKVSNIGAASPLDILTTLLSHEGSLPFEDWILVAFQHLQGSFLDLYRSLIRLGISPSSSYIIGKDYSSHPFVVAELARLGAHVVLRGSMTNPCIAYERDLMPVVAKTLGTAARQAKPSNILIVDEGGLLLRTAIRMGMLESSRIAVVEQTTRGIEAAYSARPKVPVINVARSQLKLSVEAAQVAASMIAGFQRSCTLKRPIQLGILVGFGAIGSALSEHISAECDDLVIVEPHSERRSRARIAGYRAVRDISDITVQSVDRCAVFGCTGRRAMSRSMLLDLKYPSVTLVNCASADTEFPAAFLRCISDVPVQDCLGPGAPPIKDPWRHAYRVELGGSWITLLNGGFPVNFCGQLDTVPRAEFHLTRALVLAGCHQAIGEVGKGVVKLAAESVYRQVFGDESSSRG